MTRSVKMMIIVLTLIISGCATANRADEVRERVTEGFAMATAAATQRAYPMALSQLRAAQKLAKEAGINPPPWADEMRHLCTERYLDELTKKLNHVYHLQNLIAAESFIKEAEAVATDDNVELPFRISEIKRKIEHNHLEPVFVGKPIFRMEYPNI